MVCWGRHGLGQRRHATLRPRGLHPVAQRVLIVHQRRGIQRAADIEATVPGAAALHVARDVVRDVARQKQHVHGIGVVRPVVGRDEAHNHRRHIIERVEGCDRGRRRQASPRKHHIGRHVRPGLVVVRANGREPWAGRNAAEEVVEVGSVCSQEAVGVHGVDGDGCARDDGRAGAALGEVAAVGVVAAGVELRNGGSGGAPCHVVWQGGWGRAVG